MNIKKIKIFNNGSWVEYALDGTTIDNVARLKDVENLITEAITEIDRKFEALDFEALDSDFFNSIY